MTGGRNRYYSWRKALRKKRISENVYPWFGEDWDYYDNLHQYSKNKIHCSCPACSAKTRNKGKRRNTYSPPINYKISDRRKMDAMDYAEFDYE